LLILLFKIYNNQGNSQQLDFISIYFLRLLNLILIDCRDNDKFIIDWVVGIVYKKQFEIFTLKFYKSFKMEAIENNYKDDGIKYKLYI